VKPIAVKPKTNIQEKASVITGDTKYKTIVKYTFYESGEKYVKVLLDFPNAKSLIKQENLKCVFENRSFELLIDNYKGENFKFAVPKLHCRILPLDCSYSIKTNNV